MNKKQIEAMPVNEKLLELIAPQNLKVKRDVIETGDKILSGSSCCFLMWQPGNFWHDRTMKLGEGCSYYNSGFMNDLLWDFSPST